MIVTGQYVMLLCLATMSAVASLSTWPSLRAELCPPAFLLLYEASLFLSLLSGQAAQDLLEDAERKAPFAFGMAKRARQRPDIHEGLYPGAGMKKVKNSGNYRFMGLLSWYLGTGSCSFLLTTDLRAYLR